MKKAENFKSVQAPKKTPEILVIGHCLLNKLSRVRGIKELPKFEISGRQVIQLPCPEAIYFGLKRREVTKDQLDFPGYRQFCRELFKPFANLIEDFAAAGIKIRVLGIPKSPSCGVEFTSVGGEPGKVKEFHHKNVPGSGVFIEEIRKELQRRGVPFEVEDAEI